MPLCVTTSEELPVKFQGSHVVRCCRSASCGRRVRLEVSTRIGSSTAEGCGDFYEDTETGRVYYKTRVDVTVYKYIKMVGGEPVVVATRTVTGTTSRDGPTIAVNEPCGEVTYNTEESGGAPDPADYDYVETDPEASGTTYEDAYTDEDVCAAATSGLVWGDWSAWARVMVSPEVEWEMDIATGLVNGAFLDLDVASASLGYAFETKLRVAGAFPVALFWYDYYSLGNLGSITREVLEPGVEKLFSAPLEASCALDGGFVQVFHTIGCVGPEHLVPAAV